MAGEGSSGDRGVYSESLYPLLHYGWSPLRAIRTDRYKLIGAPRPEVYDVRTDRHEEHDLSNERPNVLEDLENRLAELKTEIEREDPTSGAGPDLDPQTLAQLQALGYAAGQGGVGLEEEGDRPRADPKDKIGLHRTIMRAQSELRTDEEAAEHLRLGVEPAQYLSGGQPQHNDLEGDAAPGIFLLGFVDAAHASGSQGLEDAEVGPLEVLVALLRFLDELAQEGVLEHRPPGLNRGRAFGDPLDVAVASQASSWSLTSDEDARYASDGRAPAAVHRKARVNGTDHDWNPALDHWVFLRLPEPLKPGARYTLRVDPQTHSDQTTVPFSFDLDDTLIDTRGVLLPAALRRVSEATGLPLDPTGGIELVSGGLRASLTPASGISSRSSSRTSGIVTLSILTPRILV